MRKVKYLVIIGEVASLAHSHRVEEALRVRALRCKLTSAVLSVAARAHILNNLDQEK
jgi:hypothetical protein